MGIYNSQDSYYKRIGDGMYNWTGEKWITIIPFQGVQLPFKTEPVRVSTTSSYAIVAEVQKMLKKNHGWIWNVWVHADHHKYCVFYQNNKPMAELFISDSRLDVGVIDVASD